MSANKKCRVLVVGAGPGGYVAAIRAAQLGMDTIIVEADKTGGTCLIRGCIPSKAIIHAAERFENLRKHSAEDGHMGISITGDTNIDMAAIVDWKDSIVNRLNKGVESLLKAAGAELIKGWATFTSSKQCIVETEEGSVTIDADNIIIATGSSHIDLPFMPCDEEFIISSTGALDLQKLPKKVAVIGGGYIGLELGCALSRLGAEVTIIEGMDSVLAIMDKEIRRPVEIWLKKHKVVVHTQAMAKGAVVKGKGKSRKVHMTFEKNDEEQTIVVDKVLVTVGRRPNTKGWGLENMGVRMDSSGRFIRIDDKCQTSVPGIYAIGDVAGDPMLAHKASAQGEMVAEVISGEKRIFDKVAIPAIVFTEPEIVSVGLSPNEAKEAGEEIITGKFPLAANGRALTLEAEKTMGFIRVTARKSDHVILGIQAVGSHIAELHGEFILALEMGALLEDIADTVHAHPTMTESFHEGVLKTLGHAIHIS
ncbi:MAG: dihydrolipoyl dehydrogenase [Euryarchaeota archaeon]|jgi:dihydrolipoamide dehydrogenase|nr:dihydrolipoyl dehydrogenase [Euryarchaeota archaeon]MBT3653886.1 dihydrolipoyl dehydrogenase [Euryarchaeota archaeon]MBT3757290.1 dihydrolipoyl dehydrogenase [Euryarchaeota archaeon]MBT4050753.1 dihydrolipoyl dehydrogenase [Euryarchaeota archaeon]MBT4346647.1 dihydrolipoyl dehydrogenase [Euryarchaeota archaeon]|tara:strand:- start:1878 stop:3314 length:1437 start_codon:yes stop_codon:yes gene_type:complete